MSTDINLLRKGIIRLGILVVLLIASPIIITMGFKGVSKFTEVPTIFVGYLLVFIGISGIIFSIYYAFKAFSVLKKALFGEK
ncbi:MAG: hypothetical protein GW772_11695 [Flavobacteriia bacterium]|nr:hypothetical protein [Flavobacteriia bacterium]OIP46840.1 MAG: hypothetical protein AUK46_07280 [Flavobacteriaceae bacterium CG2_30_31_66]PIV96351.1 MAG: hypothetical protein COW43_08690 [Flavobacteriaceae bacterium CG17_big_fil_post_rev_8_21_14_2_50_31_13]PIX13207.1 MAG: hypothetical protein COZ74_07480 [Flavobacteriaceae bacterium CG_4_8_14_3_um_filter_31_8]PIY15527.1 MAG: hypothetical protein COZ16_03970 [Flavobacteriaceae bacterium CG_4_10_14_3_um_filter_31_253]PIZ11711.1 MAG: hypotheti